jgi:hypothetical protein
LSKSKRRRENKELTQMTKSQRKVKIGSFEMSKTWSLKTWATARHNQVKHSWSSRRCNGLNTASKAWKATKIARPSRRGKGSTHLIEATQMQLSLNKCNLLDECMHSTWRRFGIWYLSPFMCLSPLESCAISLLVDTCTH